MRNRRILSIVMIFIVAIMFVACGGKDKTSEDVGIMEDYVPVETTVVEIGPIFNTITLTGKVYGNKEVMVIPKVSGKVETVYVGIGDKVKKDDNLLTIDKNDIQKQVDTARKQKDSAYSNYLRLEESLKLAKTTYERTLKLYKENGVSKSQLEQAELQASPAPVEAAKSQYDIAVLALDNALDMLGDTNIKAPIEGIVTSLNMEAGEMISMSSPALTIVDMDNVYVELQITENIINELSVGQQVEIGIGAVDKTYVGKIDRISPVADSRTNLYQTKIFLDNIDYQIKPGMFAKVNFNIDYKDKVVRIPSEAVITIGNKNYVYTVVDNKAAQQEVTLGIDSGIMVEVAKGLSAKDILVIKGQQYIKDDTNIKVVRGDK